MKILWLNLPNFSLIKLPSFMVALNSIHPANSIYSTAVKLGWVNPHIRSGSNGSLSFQVMWFTWSNHRKVYDLVNTILKMATACRFRVFLCYIYLLKKNVKDSRVWQEFELFIIESLWNSLLLL